MTDTEYKEHRDFAKSLGGAICGCPRCHDKELEYEMRLRAWIALS